VTSTLAILKDLPTLSSLIKKQYQLLPPLMEVCLEPDNYRFQLREPTNMVSGIEADPDSDTVAEAGIVLMEVDAPEDTAVEEVGAVVITTIHIRI